MDDATALLSTARGAKYPTRLAQQFAGLPRGAITMCAHATGYTVAAVQRWVRGERSPGVVPAIAVVRWLRAQGVDTSLEALWG